jgi:hypothetical protein
MGKCRDNAKDYAKAMGKCRNNARGYNNNMQRLIAG